MDTRWGGVRVGGALASVLALMLAGCSTVGVGVSLPIPGVGGVGVSVDSSGRVGGGVTVGGPGGSITIGGSGRLPEGKNDDKKDRKDGTQDAPPPADAGVTGAGGAPPPPAPGR